MRRWVTWLLALGVLGAGSAAFGQGYVPNELLVKFRPGTPARVQAGVHHAIGAAVRGELAALDVEVVTLPTGTDPQQAASVYARDPAVEYAEPNYVSVANSTPNDPSFAQQWGLSKIQAPLAWNVTQGREDISIAILDSGIDLNHEDLSAKIVATQNFSTSDTDDDNYGHGTHLAGIAAAITDNGLGIAGLGSRCTLINAKVDEDNGAARSSAVAQGIAWAVDSGAKVICMSFGASTASQTVETAINYAWDRGAVLVASAGNTNSTTPNYPAFYEHCISVAATDPSDQKEAHSNFGSWVDVAAPGAGILSTLPSHPFAMQPLYSLPLGYGTLSGTSQATAFVAGLAGLVWSTPFGTSNAAVRARIEQTCDPITGTGTLWRSGRINAARAVGAAP
jgi:thermitase